MAEPYEPKLPRINFGDGHTAILAHEGAPRTDISGVQLQKLLIIPSDRLKETFEITEKELSVTTPLGYKAMWVEYPLSLVDWIKRDPVDPVLQIWCDYKGGKAPLMNKSSALLELDEMRQKEIQSRKNREAYLIQELRNAMAINAQLIKSYQEVTSKLEGVGAEESNERGEV